MLFQYKFYFSFDDSFYITLKVSVVQRNQNNFEMSVKNLVNNQLPSVKTVDILTQLVFLLSAECKKNFDSVVTVKKTYQSYLDFCSL